MRIANKLCLSLAISLTTLLGGCSDSDNSSSKGTAALSGTASKGIVSGGEVTAEELGLAGEVVRTLGTAQTDASGKYAIQIPESYEGGVIRLTLSGSATTLMRCDVPAPANCGSHTGLNDENINGIIDRGEWFSTPELNMSAILPPAEAGQTIRASINPFTDLALARAQELGTLSSETIISANQEVGALLGGVNILSTQNVDVTQSEARSDATALENYYSAMVAGLMSLAELNPTTNTPDFAQLQERLSLSFQGGAIATTDTDVNSISLDELVQAAKAQFVAVGETDLTSNLAHLETEAGALGPFDPEPGEVVVGGLANTKNFVAQLRNWFNLIQQQANGEAPPFSPELQTAGVILERASGDLATILGATLRAAAEANFDNADLAQLDIPGIQSATGTVSADPTTETVGIQGTMVRNAKAYDVDVMLDQVSAAANLREVSISGTIVSPTETLAIAPSAIEIALVEPTPGQTLIERAAGTLNIALDAIATDAQQPASASFDGTLVANLANLEFTDNQGATRQLLVPKALRLSGTFNATDVPPFEATATAQIKGLPEQFQSGEALDIAASFTLRTQLQGQPEARITIIGDMAGSEVVRSDLVIAYGGNFLALRTAPAEEDSRLTISDRNGVILELTTPEGTGSILYNGVIYATTELMQNLLKVNYTDGTFETIP